ncbi:pentapeptide repeat-containing protein [Candidatus Marinimicrobia bacterium]|nr:pentapeptide repeat-containing protein [Candidatus Neomarinimicrobiota bacterium]
MKKIILITMLMSVVFAQSDCNKSNWQEYYNSDGKDMSECDLRDANLRDANLRDANLESADLTGAKLSGAYLERANFSRTDLRGADLTGAFLTDVISSDIKGLPKSLPDGWSLFDGTLINDEGENLTPPDDMMAGGDDLKFNDIDTDGDGCISEEEFKKAKNVN